MMIDFEPLPEYDTQQTCVQAVELIIILLFSTYYGRWSVKSLYSDNCAHARIFFLVTAADHYFSNELTTVNSPPRYGQGA
jgi:hypothetical protein